MCTIWFQFGPYLLIVDQLGPFGTILEHLDHCWTNLDKCRLYNVVFINYPQKSANDLKGFLLFHEFFIKIIKRSFDHFIYSSFRRKKGVKLRWCQINIIYIKFNFIFYLIKLTGICLFFVHPTLEGLRVLVTNVKFFALIFVLFWTLSFVRYPNDPKDDIESKNIFYN